MSTHATYVDDGETGGDVLGSSSLHLLVMAPGSFTTVPLPELGAVVIGRGSTADVRLDDPLASRAHARLHVGTSLALEDLGSVNGTRVRDETIQAGRRVVIAPGEAIGIGSTVLVVRQNRSRSSTTSARTIRAEDLAADDRFVQAGSSMKRTRALAQRAASTTINVLILGETGVGKEVLARTIHRMSARANKPLICLNCAAIPESLIESELFGHSRGAFTGASTDRVGLFEAAAGGTLFLDEIGEVPLPVQARLLRVLETREVVPVGAVRPRAIDVRFVAATNRDLERDVRRGTFRADLFFRLNGLTLQIPPLRERREEIEELALTFVHAAATEARRTPPRLGPAALALLLDHQWPGNVRELKNMMERALILCDGEEIDVEHLPVDKLQPPGSRGGRDGPATAAELEPVPAPITSAPVTAPLRSPTPPPAPHRDRAGERQRILDALTACAGNQSRAAKLLGMPRRTFVTKLDAYGIPRPRKGIE